MQLDDAFDHDAIARLQPGGDFDLAGEPWRWVPPADDPGRQMQADRERYRRLLADGPATSPA